MGKPQYKQRFRAEWLNDNRYKHWLNRVEGDDRKCFCKYCKCIISAKVSDLERHRSTDKHKKAEQPFSSLRQSVLPFQKVSNETKISEGKLALFVAEHCAVRVADHLSDICTACFSDSKGCSNLKLKRSKCIGVIKHVLAPHFDEELLLDIGERKFSLLIDESNDISTIKVLGLVIRYYSDVKQRVIVTFLDFIELKECDAKGICDALKAALRKHGLNLERLLALGTDNASVMVGINNGVHAQLKSEVPNLILVKCVCHSIQLAVSHAASECMPRNLDFLIKETYNWFSHSSVRQVKYRELYSVLNDGLNPLKLVQCSATRWLSIEVAVTRVLSQWHELKLHFDMSRTQERCYTAETLHAMFLDKENYVLLTFLKPILKEVQLVNKNFEAETQDPTKLFKDLMHLIDSLCSKVVIPGKRVLVDTVIENYISPRPYLGYECEKELRENNFPVAIEIRIRERCTKFMVELVKQLRQRLPENVGVLQSMSMLSVTECLKPIKPDIIELSKLLVGDNAEYLTQVDFQWKKLHHTKWTETANTLHFWTEVANYRDSSGENPYKELSEVALSALSLPHSNADVERSFSHMNLIKTKLRNRMNLSTLSAIMSVRYGLKRNGKCCATYELPDEVVKKIGSMESYGADSSSAPHSQSQVGQEEQATHSGACDIEEDWEVFDLIQQE